MVQPPSFIGYNYGAFKPIAAPAKYAFVPNDNMPGIAISSTAEQRQSFRVSADVITTLSYQC